MEYISFIDKATQVVVNSSPNRPRKWMVNEWRWRGGWVKECRIKIEGREVEKGGEEVGTG